MRSSTIFNRENPMQIWLDTTNIDTLKKAVRLGLLYGVTTNPALIAQSGKTMLQALQDLLDHQEGPITAQVIAHDAQGMIDQGRAIFDFSSRIIVKIPITEPGLEAIHQLSSDGIPTMATVAFQPHQALTASLAGAQYIAPYIGQMEDAGQDPWPVLSSMLSIYQQGLLQTEILAASIRSVEHVLKCAEMGIPHITLKETVFHQLVATVPLTQQRVEHFGHTWNKASASFLI